MPIKEKVHKLVQRFTKKVQIISLSLFLLIFLGFLGYKYFYLAKKPVEKIKNTSKNAEVVKVLHIPNQTLEANLSRFSVKLEDPNVEAIKAVIKFKEGAKEIKLGISKDDKNNNYLFQPLYQSLLQDIIWSKITTERLTLWQRKNKYVSIADFISKSFHGRNNASYFTIDREELLKLLKPVDNKEYKFSIDTPLRSSHSFLTFASYSPLVIKLSKQDLNMYDGEDVFKISVLKDGEVLSEKSIDDDGITNVGFVKMDPQEETIILDDIEPGIYQIDVNFQGKGSDSIINHFEINQSKLIIKDHIFFLGDTPQTIWTNANQLAISTVHKIQTVLLNDLHKLEVEKTNNDYLFDLEKLTNNDNENNTLFRIDSKINDLIYKADGSYFSFSKDAFFYPEIIRSKDLSTLDNLDGIDNILTSYSQPKKEGEWLVAETVFDLNTLKINKNIINFLLETTNTASQTGGLKIEYLDIYSGDKNKLLKEENVQGKEELNKNSLENQENEISKSLISTVKHYSQRTINWLTDKYNNLTSWASETWQQLFKKTPKTDDKGIITINNTKPSSSPSPSPKPSPLPSPSPSPTQKITNFVRILNGGAGQGQAGEFAKVLTAAGFTNVSAETAEKTDYKNAIIRYKQEDEKVVLKLEELLKKDYQTVDKQKIATTSAEIVVIIGAK